jgi:hypothetical protein
VPGNIWLTFPDGTEQELTNTLTIGRGPDATEPLGEVSPRDQTVLSALQRQVVHCLCAP